MPAYANNYGHMLLPGCASIVAQHSGLPGMRADLGTTATVPTPEPACHAEPPASKRAKTTHLNEEKFDRACEAVDRLSTEERSLLLEYLGAEKPPAHTTAPAASCNLPVVDHVSHLQSFFDALIDTRSMDANDVPAVAESLHESMLSVLPSGELVGMLCTSMLEMCSKAGILNNNMAERLLAVPLVRSEMHKPPPGLNPDDIARMPEHPDKIRRWKELNQEMVKRLVLLQTSPTQKFWLRDGVKPIAATAAEREVFYELLRTVRVHVTKPESAAFVRWMKQNLPTQFRRVRDVAGDVSAPEVPVPAPQAAIPPVPVAMSQGVPVQQAVMSRSEGLGCDAQPVQEGRTVAQPLTRPLQTMHLQRVPTQAQLLLTSAPAAAQPAANPQPLVPPQAHASREGSATDCRPATDRFDVRAYTLENFACDANSLEPLLPSGSPLMSVKDVGRSVKYDSHPELRQTIAEFDNALERFGIARGMSGDIYQHLKAATLSLGLRCNKTQLGICAAGLHEHWPSSTLEVID